MTTIGIDFGTYNSEAAYILPNGEVILLQAYHGPTSQGYTIPSFIKFFANGKFEKYGEPARQDLSVAPHLVVWGIKRLLGKSYQKAKDEKELDRFQYPIEKANDGSMLIPIGNKKCQPIEICKIFLEKLKRRFSSIYS
jgi:molecular chaperone DnaK